MRVHARVAVVLELRKGAEHAFELEQQEVVVHRQQVQRLDFELRVAVRQRAKLAVLALASLDEVFAELLVSTPFCSCRDDRFAR